MRRTIHDDQRKFNRTNRRTTRSILPSNFQFDLEEGGEQLRVKRSSDGTKEQMVPVEEYNKIQTDLTQSKLELAESRAEIADLQDQIIEIQEVLLTLI